MNTSSSIINQSETHYVGSRDTEIVAYAPISEVKSLVSVLLEKTTIIGSHGSEYRRLRDRRYAKYLLRCAENMASVGAQKVALTAEDYKWLKTAAGEGAR
ncbi:hypothetical protein [Ochrobactrum sp. A-1]|uniref:hypothetical protein n=1 Tax=Ochrobactrum sp. A-1 TaxID=2920940 RepID=UPI001F0B5AA8|nr:hypothetical protein [Ochrobactrum sp. A-1]